MNRHGKYCILIESSVDIYRMWSYVDAYVTQLIGKLSEEAKLTIVMYGDVLGGSGNGAKSWEVMEWKEAREFRKEWDKLKRSVPTSLSVLTSNPYALTEALCFVNSVFGQITSEEGDGNCYLVSFVGGNLWAGECSECGFVYDLYHHVAQLAKEDIKMSWITMKPSHIMKKLWDSSSIMSITHATPGGTTSYAEDMHHASDPNQVNALFENETKYFYGHRLPWKPSMNPPPYTSAMSVGMATSEAHSSQASSNSLSSMPGATPYHSVASVTQIPSAAAGSSFQHDQSARAGTGGANHGVQTSVAPVKSQATSTLQQQQQQQHAHYQHHLQMQQQHGTHPSQNTHHPQNPHSLAQAQHIPAPHLMNNMSSSHLSQNQYHSPQQAASNQQYIQLQMQQQQIQQQAAQRAKVPPSAAKQTSMQPTATMKQAPPAKIKVPLSAQHASQLPSHASQMAHNQPTTHAQQQAMSHMSAKQTGHNPSGHPSSMPATAQSMATGAHMKQPANVPPPGITKQSGIVGKQTSSAMVQSPPNTSVIPPIPPSSTTLSQLQQQKQAAQGAVGARPNQVTLTSTQASQHQGQHAGTHAHAMQHHSMQGQHPGNTHAQAQSASMQSQTQPGQSHPSHSQMQHHPQMQHMQHMQQQQQQYAARNQNSSAIPASHPHSNHLTQAQQQAYQNMSHSGIAHQGGMVQGNATMQNTNTANPGSTAAMSAASAAMHANPTPSGAAPSIKLQTPQTRANQRPNPPPSQHASTAPSQAHADANHNYMSNPPHSALGTSNHPIDLSGSVVAPSTATYLHTAPNPKQPLPQHLHHSGGVPKSAAGAPKLQIATPSGQPLPHNLSGQHALQNPLNGQNKVHPQGQHAAQGHPTQHTQNPQNPPTALASPTQAPRNPIIIRGSTSGARPMQGSEAMNQNSNAMNTGAPAGHMATSHMNTQHHLGPSSTSQLNPSHNVGAGGQIMSHHSSSSQSHAPQQGPHSHLSGAMGNSGTNPNQAGTGHKPIITFTSSNSNQSSAARPGTITINTGGANAGGAGQPTNPPPRSTQIRLVTTKRSGNS